jgi:capsid portal protein
MAHRVPVNKVGLPEGVSLAVARDADKTFKEQVCRPEQRIVEKKLNKIFRSMQDVLNFRLNELTLTDEMEQAKIDEIYLRMQTVVPNEVRRRKGWPGLPDGDKVVELKPQEQAEQRAQGNGNRARDQQRQSNTSDSGGGTRNAQGEGRRTS